MPGGARAVKRNREATIFLGEPGGVSPRRRRRLLLRGLTPPGSPRKIVASLFLLTALAPPGIIRPLHAGFLGSGPGRRPVRRARRRQDWRGGHYAASAEDRVG